MGQIEEGLGSAEQRLCRNNGLGMRALPFVLATSAGRLEALLLLRDPAGALQMSKACRRGRTCDVSQCVHPASLLRSYSACMEDG